METKLMILFDGYCNLCSWAVKFIQAHDSKAKFQFTGLQSKKGMLLLSQLGLPAHQANTVVFIHEDHFYTKSTAILQILKSLDGWPRLLAVFLLIPRPLRDLLYDVVAKTRYQLFGKRNTCYRI